MLTYHVTPKHSNRSLFTGSLWECLEWMQHRYDPRGFDVTAVPVLA